MGWSLRRKLTPSPENSAFLVGSMHLRVHLMQKWTKSISNGENFIVSRSEGAGLFAFSTPYKFASKLHYIISAPSASPGHANAAHSNPSKPPHPFPNQQYTILQTLGLYALHRVATSSCRGHVDELATEPFLLLHREHGTGYRRSWNCCDRRTRFVVIWKHFCFILSTGYGLTLTRSSSRERNTSASVTVTVTVYRYTHGSVFQTTTFYRECKGPSIQILRLVQVAYPPVCIRSPRHYWYK